MKKVFFVLFILVVFVFSFFFFIKKDISNGILLNNKNHEYILLIMQSSADNKKTNYLSNFYFDKNAFNEYVSKSKSWIEAYFTDDTNYDKRKYIIEKYNNLLKKNKRINLITRAEIYCFLGNMYFYNKDYANAVYCYNKALYFAPYSIEIKYNIKDFINFINKITFPEKILENNYDKSIKQLQIFVQDKESFLNKKETGIKTELKNTYLKNMKYNGNINLICNKNKDNLKQEISSLEKEKENVEKQIKVLNEKCSKQEISEISSVKKEILKDFSETIKYFRQTLVYWEKLEKSVIKRISKKFVNTESKTLQDKYFAFDMFFHKKNVWNNLLDRSKEKFLYQYKNAVKRNVYLIDHNKQKLFNKLNEKAKFELSGVVGIDEKIVNFFANREKYIVEEKNNISFFIKDIVVKKKELYSSINSALNSQKKKNLQKELDKLKEKERALRQEYSDCDKDLTELETMCENVLIYNEIDILKIKNYVVDEIIRINKTLAVVNEYMKTFCDKQKVLLSGQQEILKNVEVFNLSNLKKYNDSLLICDENFSNMVIEQVCLYEQQKILLLNYIEFLSDIKNKIDSLADVKDNSFFIKLKVFIDKELKFFKDKENTLNKIFEYDKILKLQIDITSADITAQKNIDLLENIAETKNLIKTLFPKKQKVKSKKHQEKIIASKMKNYEVNTETVQEEVKDTSSKKEKKKKKNKKKKEKKKKKK